MKCAAKLRRSLFEYAPATSGTRRRASRASCAPVHCGWRAVAAYPYILQAEDEQQACPAISASRDSDTRTKIAPTANLPPAPAWPAVAPVHRAGQDLRHTK